MQRNLLGAAILALLLVACGSSKTKRVDIGDDDEIMGTGIESADVESMSQLAKDLLGHPELTGPYVEQVPTVAISPVVNNTRFDFDGELFVRRIRQQLVEHSRGRIRFVTRSELDEMVIERERTEKREGERTATKLTTKTGADYYLTGTASAISKVGRGMESDAIWIDFRLLDAENGELIWEKGYATKKVGKAGVIYR
jgi:PBP1b-binding outer membrane lipoprotein LpoB